MKSKPFSKSFIEERKELNDRIYPLFIEISQNYPAPFARFADDIGISRLSLLIFVKQKGLLSLPFLHKIRLFVEKFPKNSSE